MARTISEIYTVLITEKETHSNLDALVPNPDTVQTFLDDLTTTSKVAIWRLLLWVVAVGMWSHEQVFDLHKAEVEETAADAVTGTVRWYIDQAERFQYGDELTWNSTTLKFEYSSTSTGDTVVQKAAAIEVGSQVRIKVAKDDGADGLEPLTAPQETAFTTYINRIKFAGTNISITNNPPDSLKLALTINYDPLILDSSGVLISDGVTTPVDDAISDYISNLPFNGILNLTALVDALQAAEGVVDPVLSTVETTASGGVYTSSGQNYTADAGYLELDEVESVITYTAVTI